MEKESIKSGVQDYYGKVLQTTEDLKTSACCDTDEIPSHIKTALKNVSDEVLIKYYGCGLVVPNELSGLQVLDLGSGSGRDCFVLAQLVGENGLVTGVDMTDEQINVAINNIEFHQKKFGFKQPNTKFIKADLEDLDNVGLKPGSQDLIVSNCVINLVPDKKKVLADTYSLLKPGGEMYFSDIYCDRRIPQHLVEDKELYGECLSGALYWNDFENLAKKVGFTDPRIVDSRRLEINNKKLEEKLKDFKFYSVTYRLFKLETLDDHCEDYGQAVVYRGGIETSEDSFKLDDHHVFLKGKVESVCGNSYRMLHETRFEKYFDFYGNFEQHFGIFPGCGMSVPYSESTGSGTGSTDSSGACC